MKDKHKKEKALKPKYNMAQNSWFMIALAWRLKEKKVLVLAVMSAVLAVASNLVNLYVSPMILSAVERHVDIGELMLTIGGFAAALIFVSAASAYVRANTLYGRVTVRTGIINLINTKASRTSYPNIHDEKFLNMLRKSAEICGGNNGASEAVWNTLTGILQNVLGFAVYAGLLSNVQPVLLLVILLTSLTGYFVNRQIYGYGYRHRDEEAEYVRHIYYFNDGARDLGKAKDIRIFGLRPWLDELYQKAMSLYTAFHRRAQGVYAWAGIADLLFAFARNGVAYAYLIGNVLKGGIGVAEFLLYFSAVGGFSGWVSGIMNSFNTLHTQSLELSTLRECIDYEEKFKFEDGEPLAADPRGKYEIRLENVSYRYPGSDRDVLKNLDLTIHPGEKLAVVGLNGAGKTTLVKLICGFLDPTEGRVLLDGKDIRVFNRRDYYTLFSAVFQEFSLLAGSIAMNIAQTDEGIDMDRVRFCAGKAGLKDKIESLSRGYETNLNREVYEEAILLSGGETQRLMLARALYKDAPFLILDEPTAALDPIAESDMYRKYNEMADGRSSVYISHRLASTRFCDRIVMIDNAGICEQGTHDELLKAGGKYAELYEVQSRYYREEGAENGEKR